MRAETLPPAVANTVLTKGRYKGRKLIEIENQFYCDWILAQCNSISELRRLDITVEGHKLSSCPFDELRALAHNEEITVFQKEIIDEWVSQRWPRTNLGSKEKLPPVKLKGPQIGVDGQRLNIFDMADNELEKLLKTAKTCTRGRIGEYLYGAKWKEKVNGIIVKHGDREIDISKMAAEELRWLALDKTVRPNSKGKIFRRIEQLEPWPIGTPEGYKRFSVAIEKVRLVVAHWPLSQLKEIDTKNWPPSAKTRLEGFIKFREALEIKSAA